MNISINLNFQCRTKNNRPDDASLNNEVIRLNKIENIPVVGDFIRFSDGGEKLYQVKTRLFDYTFPKVDSCSIMANVVVEEQPEKVYNSLIHL